MIVRRRILLLVALACLVLTASCFGRKAGKPLRLATTTSVRDSGLLSELLPAFEKDGAYKVETQAVGSGKALAMLEAGEADVAITHAPDEERDAASAGRVGRRTPFMHNDFVIAGPKEEVGLVAGAGDFRDVLRKIAASGKKLVSRGDGSGTHLREQALFKASGLALDAGFVVVANAGMGDTLRRASKEHAFTLTDRSTFVSLRDDLDLAIVFQGDDELRNYYSVIEPGEKATGDARQGARALAAFVRSSEGRALIGRYGVEKAKEPLFTPEE